MTDCARCGAELLGSRKFCAACGLPSGDPRSPSASTGVSPASHPNAAATLGYAEERPSSRVDPFARTAGPSLDPSVGASVRTSSSEPVPSSAADAYTTPGVGDPSAAPQVSKLAISNIDSFDARAASRGELEQAITAVPDVVPPAQLKGTQFLPIMANPGSLSPFDLPNAQAAPRRQDRTHLHVAATVAPPPPRAHPVTQHPAQSAPHQAPHAQPMPPAVNGWTPLAAPAPSYGVPYQPGARVSVTWANGQRYPGTVHLVSGSQRLVVFPDGQHHWVELPYLAPG